MTCVITFVLDIKKNTDSERIVILIDFFYEKKIKLSRNPLILIIICVLRFASHLKWISIQIWYRSDVAIIVMYGVDDIISMNRSYSELLIMFENVYKHIEKSILLT